MAEEMLESTWSITVNSCRRFPYSQCTTVDTPTQVSTGDATNPLVLATFQGARHGTPKKRVLFYGHVLINVTKALPRLTALQALRCYGSPGSRLAD